MPPLRIVLVDDHLLFREGLARLLSYYDDFTVVGEATDCLEACAIVGQQHPDLVLMDIELPGEGDGVSATRQITLEHPDVRVVILTAYDETARLLEAIKAGAQGYLVKNIRSAELVEQLRGLVRGEAAISRRMATRLLEEFRRAPDLLPSEDAELTTRELEVLTLLAERLSNKEIAERLVLSEHTVKNHVKNILSKLHLRNRRYAAAYGVARGLVRPMTTNPPTPSRNPFRS